MAEDPLFQKRLEDMLLYPHEDLDVEYKSWIDLSEDVAKVRAAIFSISDATAIHASALKLTPPTGLR